MLTARRRESMSDGRICVSRVSGHFAEGCGVVRAIGRLSVLLT